MTNENINWIEWNGGECPVPVGHDVSVKFRCGYTERNKLPSDWRWDHRDGSAADCDIVAYFDHDAERSAALSTDTAPVVDKIVASELSPFDACANNEDDDLTWLAKNVDEWSLAGISVVEPLPLDAKLYVEAGNIFWHDNTTEWDTPTYSRDQWLQRRKELGLEGDSPELPDSSTVSEIEDKVARNELSAAQVFTQMNQLIPRPAQEQPVSEWDCEVLNTKFGLNADWEKCKILFKGEFCLVYKSESHIECAGRVDECDFRPLKTAEQKAADAKENLIDRIQSIPKFSADSALQYANDRAFLSELYDAGFLSDQLKESE